MAEPRVGEESVTSQIFRVRGQRSRWRYPDQNLTPENCEILRDVNLSERGVANSRPGYIAYSPDQLSGGEAVVGLFDLTFSGDSNKRVVITPTKVYTDTGSARVNITGTALSGGADNKIHGVFIKDQFVFSNSVNTVRKWNGNDSTPTNTSDLTTVPWTKVDGLFLHKNLLMIWGPTESSTKYNTRIRWCDINRQTYAVDINTWPDTNRYEIYDGGTPIVGCVDNWGLALIFKSDGLYQGEIFYDPIGHIDFRLGKPIRGFSPIASKSLIARPEFVFGVAQEGLFIIRPDLSFTLVSSDDSTEWFNLNQDRLQYAQSFVSERDHQVRTIISSSGNTNNQDIVLVWDWDTGDIWIDRPSHKLNYAEKLLVSGEEFHWTGSSTGYLYQGNKITYLDDAGTGYNWRIKMSPNDLGLPGMQKHILNVRTFHRRRVGQQDISFTVHIDQGREPSVNGTLAVAQTSKWNAGRKWSTGESWPGASARVTDFFVDRMCETMAPEWVGQGPSGIEGYIVEYIPLEG